MKSKYYEPDGTMNEEVFAKRLDEIHNEVDGADLKGLLLIRNTKKVDVASLIASMKSLQ